MKTKTIKQVLPLVLCALMTLSACTARSKKHSSSSLEPTSTTSEAPSSSSTPAPTSSSAPAPTSSSSPVPSSSSSTPVPSSSSQPVPPTPSEKTFDELKNSIVNEHNYTIDVVSYYENFPTERYEGSVYNIDNSIYYYPDPEYSSLMWYGYIKVKDQGIADFNLGYQSDDVVLSSFVATNPDLGIYDIHGGVVEYILESSLTYVSENHFRVSQQDLVGIVGTFSQLELAYIENPEHIDIVKVGNTIQITSILTARYYDEETLEAHDNEPVYVGLTIKEIGSTHSSLLESFITDDSKKVVAPTSWDAGLLSDFHNYYNDYVPPFIEGLGYSFHYSTDWNGLKQKYEIKGQDFTSGDLRSSYASKLTSTEGFVQVSTDVYEKRELNAEGSLNNVYRVEMNYVPKTQPYAGHTIGYFYTEGIFQITYTMFTEVVGEINTIEAVNSYLDTTNACGIVPFYPEEEYVTQVKGFDDHTETLNQLYGGFLFATSLTGYFKIYIASYEDAQSFYTAYLANCAAKGFDRVEADEGNVVFITDAQDSILRIVNPSSMTKAEYEAIGYLQCQIVIRDKYEPGTVTVTSLSLSGQTTAYSVGDAFSFDGTCTAHFSDHTSQVVTPDSVSTPDMSSAGQKVVTVTYQGVSKTYKITVTDASAYTITYHAIDTSSNPISADAIGASSVLPSSGSLGDVINCSVVAGAGYSYVQWMFPWDYFNDDYWVEYFNDVAEYEPTDSVFSFRVSNYNVDIYLVFNEGSVPTTHSVSFNQGTHVSSIAHEDLSAVNPGDTVSFTVTCEEGYEINSVTPSPTVSFDVVGSTYSFTMPNEDVSISVTAKESSVEDTYAVTIQGDSGVFYINKSNPADFTKVTAGTQVAFSFTLNDGYELVSVICDDPSVEIIKWPFGNNAYRFEMPAKNVVITITTQSTGGGGEEAQLEYDHGYVTYVDESTVEEVEDIVSGDICSKLTLTFYNNGTGQYKREKYNRSGTITGTYTLTFTYSYNESNGSFDMTHSSGYNSDFVKWRLFTGDDSSNKNNTGVFSDGVISIKVVDSSETVTATLSFKY